MELPKLGVLSKVDLRRVWSHEAADFTPWLAQKENLAKLGSAVGMELEAEHTEVACGAFSADIVARELSSDNYVVIENQLGKTDHDHLGKSLTYASALGAKTVIWVAGDFTDEHRKTLDWLNDSSSEDVAFFGVQVELWSIDGSAPAARFNVVSRPTELVKQAAAVKSGELTDSRKLQMEVVDGIPRGSPEEEGCTVRAVAAATVLVQHCAGQVGRPSVGYGKHIR